MSKRWTVITAWPGAAFTPLARAFHDDPGIVWILPNEGQRRRLLFWNHKKFLQYGLRAGRVFTTPGSVEGVATWLPPERPMMAMISPLSTRNDTPFSTVCWP